MIKYIIMQFKSEIEYTKSFILTVISQFIAFLMYITVIYSLFDKFGNLNRFNIYHVIIGFGIVQFGQSFSEGLLRGFDKFSEIIKNGNFDILLIRPENIYLQILGSKIDFSKFIKSIAALIILAYGIIKLNIYTNTFYILIIIMMLIGSTVIFSSIFIIGAALCFKTIEGLEVINIFVYGTKDFAQYPIGIYNKFVRTFFIYIVPIAIASYFPLLYITNQSNNLLYAFLPLLSFLTLIPACLLFNLGVKKYKSTGS